VVFLDDVTDAWFEIRDVFNAIAGDSRAGYTALGHDGRIGALQRDQNANPAARTPATCPIPRGRAATRHLCDVLGASSKPCRCLL
jgi:hypothetical protein